MLHRIYTIYDSKTEAYLQPFFLQTHGQAIRAITDCVNDRDHQFGKHPEDYTLFHLGSFEDRAAEWDLLPTAHILGKCIEFVTEETIERFADSAIQLRKGVS